MKRSLAVRYTKESAKYLKSLDTAVRSRILEKVAQVAADPRDPRHSYPLTNSEKRSSRVGKYRILMLVVDDTLLVSDIDSRGQVYRNV